jgi:glycosyltransferase Alg8
VVTNPSFRRQVENDVIEHWLWGSFAMLSGDDKSTWYWLAAHQRRLLYVPDAMVTTYEVIPGLGVHRALANIRRWSGNSVRHSWRAIKLGPRKLGWFAWWSLLDQRLTMVTILFGPAVATMGILAGRWEMVAGYFLWILCSRIAHASIAWRQGRRFSAFYVPLQILSDWATALTKLWVLFHPAKQNWMNRGKRTLNTTKGSAFYGLRSGFAHYLYGFTCATILLVIGCLIGVLPVAREARLFLNPGSKAPVRHQSRAGTSLMLGAMPALPGGVEAAEEPSATTPKRLMLRPWMALKSASTDAENNQRKRVESLLHEQTRP